MFSSLRWLSDCTCRRLITTHQLPTRTHGTDGKHEFRTARDEIAHDLAHVRATIDGQRFTDLAGNFVRQFFSDFTHKPIANTQSFGELGIRLLPSGIHHRFHFLGLHGQGFNTPRPAGSGKSRCHQPRSHRIRCGLSPGVFMAGTFLSQFGIGVCILRASRLGSTQRGHTFQASASHSSPGDHGHDLWQQFHGLTNGTQSQIGLIALDPVCLSKFLARGCPRGTCCAQVFTQVQSLIQSARQQARDKTACPQHATDGRTRALHCPPSDGFDEFSIPRPILSHL